MGRNLLKYHVEYGGDALPQFKKDHGRVTREDIGILRKDLQTCINKIIAGDPRRQVLMAEIEARASGASDYTSCENELYRKMHRHYTIFYWEVLDDISRPLFAFLKYAEWYERHQKKSPRTFSDVVFGLVDDLLTPFMDRFSRTTKDTLFSSSIERPGIRKKY